MLSPPRARVELLSAKDFSKLKYSVPDFIKSDNDLNKFVFSISDADIKDGGEGAILVKLRNL